ncbi:MAG: beta-lactamase family protein [Burkholderiales bacterium]|nr:beta-lactamase family protein [Burkholderiales bacterium]MBH2016597.1 beta-lactamase family protein [Burkholderiales bacterium]
MTVIRLTIATALMMGALVPVSEAAPPSSFNVSQAADLKLAMDQQGVPGAVVALVAGGELKFAVAAGWADCKSQRSMSVDTPMMLASLVKPLVGMAARREAARQVYFLDRPVASFVPWSSPANGAVTLHGWLAHAAGMAGGAVPAATTLVHAPPDAFASSPAGRFSYGNAGFHLASAVLEEVSGVPIGMALARELGLPGSIAPVLLRDLPENAATGHLTGLGCQGPIPLRQAWALASPGAGQGVASLSEMVPWLLALATSSWHAGFFSEVSRRAVPVHRGRVDVSYALGWYAHRNDVGPVYEHNGFLPGYGGFIRVVPSRGFALMVLANQGPGVPLTRFIDRLTRETLPGWRPHMRGRASWMDPRLLPGTWVNSEGFRLRFELHQGHLQMCELPAGAAFCCDRFDTMAALPDRLKVRHPQFVDPLDVFLDRNDPANLAIHYLSRRFEREPAKR